MKTTPKFEVAANQLIAAATATYLKMIRPDIRLFVPNDLIVDGSWDKSAAELRQAIAHKVAWRHLSPLHSINELFGSFPGPTVAGFRNCRGAVAQPRPYATTTTICPK